MHRARAAQLTNCNPKRFSRWVAYRQIIPYYDQSTGTLLYSLTEIRNLAPWRQYKTIVKHLGETQARQIKATAPKKKIVVDKYCVLIMYHVPQLAHV